jgi:hypothetical protein
MLYSIVAEKAVLPIRRIRMFSGLLDSNPDPLVRGMYPDPDPYSIYHQAKIVRKP